MLKKKRNLSKILLSKQPKVRNRAALIIRKIADNQAIMPLLSAIFKKRNRNYNGTLVYALQVLDCSNYLKEIFKILFFEGFEAKHMAYSILCDQEFVFTKTDLIAIQKMYREYEKIACKNDTETNEMIRDSYVAYMSYLG